VRLSFDPKPQACDKEMAATPGKNNQKKHETKTILELQNNHPFF